MGSELGLGFLAGVASRAVSNPLNLVTMRLQTEKQDAAEAAEKDDSADSEPEATDVLSVVKHLYTERGILGFWRGKFPPNLQYIDYYPNSHWNLLGFETTILLSINPSITLALFQLILRLTRSKSIKPTPKEAFIGGAVSNSIGELTPRLKLDWLTVLTAIAFLYPLILAKTRLQARKTSESTLISVLDEASRSNSLYHGLDLQIAKGFLSQGMTFLVKERSDFQAICQRIVLMF